MDKNKSILSKLFAGGDPWYENACVNFKSDHSDGYAWGYKEAADYLAQDAADMNKQDLFIYPIIFLYRHYFP